MGAIGYAASFEQFHPNDLLAYCQTAEKHGFEVVSASDHFHPWVPSQGHSAFVWSWMGALGATTKLRFGTGVTPPGYRYHPAVLAQAAATIEAMFPGRFFLGLGAGEALNEHIVGEYWPEAPTRLERLVESIEIIEKLFTGKSIKHQGKHFRIESARLYTLPDAPPPIYVATSGPIMAGRTGKLVDGIITVGAADEKIANLMSRFERGAREAGKDPSTLARLLQIKVSYAATDQEAIDSAMRDWPNGGMNFPKADIRTPEDFEAMAKLVRPENFKNRVLTTADLEQHTAYIQHFIDLGFDEIHVHNVNREQDAFIKAYGEKVIPNLNWG
ncbi:MAG TPA: TIGR03557 family F420-dependent LLM class oxidoreductase [Thermomicrobiales bacterium]|nr:TIGR03557 family F420-dependent LLM class oxidoreductase [Thermomicrobiales bacterium]